MSAPTYAEVLRLAEQLTPDEQRALAARLQASAAQSGQPEPHEAAAPSDPSSEHWGRALNALLDTLDMSAWQDVDDPVAWVKAQRDAEHHRRLGDWGADA